MLRLLADENFNQDIVRGLRLRDPQIDLVCVQEAGLMGATDEELLAWAGQEGRIVLTHDQATMPDYAYHRLGSGQEMSGVFVLHGKLPVGVAIAEILLVIACSEQEEWRGRVVRLPL